MSLADSPSIPTLIVRAICGLLAAAIASGAIGAEQGPTFQFFASPGPYFVGLSVVQQYDRSRTYRPLTDEFGKPYQAERARPLQTLVWYPADRSDGRPLTMADYVGFLATETDFHGVGQTRVAKTWISAMKSSIAAPLWAVRDASPSAGRFPVIIYAPGGSDMAWENVDLCEYLASFGYVVLSSANLGASGRTMTIDLAGANAKARDISFLVGYAESLSDADGSEVAVVSHSWGGIAALFAAARDSRIDAIVALDGSMRYFPGLVRRAGDVQPEEMSIPLMFFTQRNFSLEDEDSELTRDDKDGPNVLNAWTHGDLISVHVMALYHEMFTSVYERNEDRWWELSNVVPGALGDYGREDAANAYAAVARYTLNFLNAYLKHQQTGADYLRRTPAENGLPPHILEVTYRPAAGAPVTLDIFRSEVGRQGFDHADAIYAAFHRREPRFSLRESDLTDWSDTLIDGRHLPQAIALLKLNAQIHPDSGYACVSLGDAYMVGSQRELAIDSYRRALEREPANSAARRKLRTLLKPGSANESAQ